MLLLGELALVAAHEAGHALAARLEGAHPRARLRMARRLVPYPVVLLDRELEPRGQLMVALAGPAVNLLLAAPLAATGLWQLALMSWALGVAELLPLRLLGVPLDGFVAREAANHLRGR